jgi:TonB family protein
VCGAQDTLPADAHKVGGGVSSPRLLYKVEPEYSEEARKSRLEGTVTLRIVVGSDGKDRDFKVLRRLGLGLDENAITASRPVIEKGPAPRVADDAISATATATFDIDEKGMPVNLQVWRFKPASQDGRPTSVSCTMDFVRGG